MSFLHVPVNLRDSDSSGAVNLDKCYDWLNSVDREKKDKYTITSDIVLPKALDGGWGWIVVFGSFSVTCICGGIFASFGVLYSELLTYYNQSKCITSLVGSVFYGVSMLLGPLASVLTSRYGCRVVTILGGLVSSLGMLFSMFASSINVLLITFGCIVGTGFCLCFITSVTIVSFYFDKKISLATGIAVCGGGFGTVTFAPFIEYLIQEFKLTGMFLILSGVCLNLVVCGMLFRPLRFTKKERINKMLNRFDKIPYDRGDIEVPANTFGVSSVDAKRDDTMSLVCVPTFVHESLRRRELVNLINALHWGKNPDQTLHRYMVNGLFVNKYWRSIQPSTDNVFIQMNSTERLRILSFDSSMENPDFVHAMKRGSILIAQGEKVICSLRSTRRHLSTDSVPVLNTAPRRSVHYVSKFEINRKSSPKKLDHHDGNRTSFGAFSDRTYHPDDVILPGYKNLFIHVPLYRRDIFFRRLSHGSCVVGTSCPQLYVTDIYGREKIYFMKRLSSGMVKCLTNLVDFSLFRNFFFCIFLMSHFIYYFWSSVPYLYATDHAINIGVDRQDAAILVSYIGVANTLGLIFFGVIGDLDVNLLQIYSGASVVAGVFVALIPFTNFKTMIGCYVLFGFFIAVVNPLTTVILVQYLGLNKLTNAYGLQLLFQGLASFIGPVVAGYTADVSGNYNMSFYCTGIFFMLSGLVLYVTYIPRFCTGSPVDLSAFDQKFEKVHDTRESFA